MYGLRVAWCVFGDARVEMARDLFGRSSPSSGIVGGDTEVAEVHRAGSISVAMPIHEMAFEWEQPGPSARYSYLEIDQHDSESDSDSANSSDSDYDSVSEEETDSGESEDLDDDDEIHREVLAAYHQASLDSSPELGKHAQAADDDSHWEVLTFEVRLSVNRCLTLYSYSRIAGLEEIISPDNCTFKPSRLHTTKFPSCQLFPSLGSFALPLGFLTIPEAPTLLTPPRPKRALINVYSSFPIMSPRAHSSLACLPLFLTTIPHDYFTNRIARP
jgi:hypothetical protein